MGSLQCSGLLCTVSRSSKASGQVKLWLDCSGFGSEMDLSFQLPAEHMPVALSGYLAFKELLFRDITHTSQKGLGSPWIQRGPWVVLVCVSESFRQPSVNLLQISFILCRFKRDLQQLKHPHINLRHARLLTVSTDLRPLLSHGLTPAALSPSCTQQQQY